MGGCAEARRPQFAAVQEQHEPYAPDEPRRARRPRHHHRGVRDGRSGHPPRVLRRGVSGGCPARCFLPVRSGDVIDSASNLEHLKFAKIAAVSFYAGSLFTTAGAALAPGRSGGPLKLSLMVYHALICLWSTAYYTLDFLDRVPLVRSERDGMIEYSAIASSPCGPSRPP